MFKRDRQIIDLRNSGRPIAKVYYLGRLIWERITQGLSCFANGYWLDENPWTDNLSWKDSNNK